MNEKDKVNKEYESRQMISDEIYNSLNERYKEVESFVQTNFYHDTDIFSLMENHAILRQRVGDNFNEVTLKVKGDNGDTEINLSLDKDEDFKLNETMKEFLIEKNIKEEDLKELTSLTTIRKEISFDNHLLVLDKNTYGDITDYNIEIEANSLDLAEEEMNKIRQEFNLTKDKNYESKTRRAFHFLQNCRN